MSRNRLEAFSDGVFAIIITIMVLELKVPHDTSFEALAKLLPVFLSYVLSFVFVGIYWNNHHHMLHLVERVNGKVLWANLHLLFWLSLIPFVTGWMGENHAASLPTATYGVVLFLSAIAYYILQTILVAHHGPDSKLKKALVKTIKEKISLALYLASIPLAFLNSWGAIGIYVFVALIWVIPDRRIEIAAKEDERKYPKSVMKTDTNGKWLEILEEDRNGNNKE